MSATFSTTPPDGSASSGGTAIKPPASQRKVWTMALAGMAVGLLIYLILPLLGVKSLANLFEFKKLMLLCMALIGGITYVAYMRFVLPRPQILLGFMLLAWPLVDYVTNMLLLEFGINTHMRPLLIMAVAVPGIALMWRYRDLLWRTIPWYKYYLLFFGWLLLYFIFNNANASDPRFVGDSPLEGSMSVVQMTSYFYCLLAIAVPALIMQKIKNYQRLFDSFNVAFIGVSSFESLLTIGGYPFGVFNMQLDGFTRALGIFTHPNPFAHHMGVLMVYLLGLLCYYQGKRQNRIAAWILLGGLAVNFIAFLLGLSKTAISDFLLCGFILLMLNLAVPAIRKRLPALLLAVVLMLPIGVFGFQALSGKNFMELIESRVEQTESMTWRQEIWQELLADMEGPVLLGGHGFTAANATVFQLSFNDAKNAKPLMMVHNGYIALLYDLGVPGYLMFVAALSMIIFSAKACFDKTRPELRTGYSILIAMAVYFLFACGFDEMTYMFDAPILFWGLASMVAGMQWRERESAPPGKTGANLA